MHPMERNIKVFNVYIFMGRLEMWLPIYILFLLDKGFSMTEIAVLDAMWYVATLIFEVPTGAVTDRYGKKISIFIAVIFQFISFFVLAFGKTFSVIAFSYLLWGFASSFETGTYSAFLYDSLKVINREDDYRKVMGRMTTISILASALGSVTAGYMAGVHLSLPILFTASMFLLMAPLIVLFTEPEVEDVREPTYFMHIKESARFVLHHRLVALLILYSSIFGAAVWALHIFYQPLLSFFDIPVEGIGILYLFFKLFSAAGAHSSDAFYRFVGKKSIYVIPACFVTSVLCMGFFVSRMVVSFIFMIFFIGGVYSPIISDLVNKNIPSGKRATIISLGSIISCLIPTIINPILGRIADLYSLQMTFKVLGIGVLLSMSLILVFLRKEVI
ncbi:MAG: MFS transporter [Theionarchaea archaeon]|nr:MFS transporter [Theionarchaea archaeon]